MQGIQVKTTVKKTVKKLTASATDKYRDYITYEEHTDVTGM